MKSAKKKKVFSLASTGREVECAHDEKQYKNGFCMECLKGLVQERLDDPSDPLHQIGKGGKE